MFANERRVKIAEMVARQQSVTVAELMEQFDIEGLVRTGLTGLKRGKSERPEELNQKNN